MITHYYAPDVDGFCGTCEQPESHCEGCKCNVDPDRCEPHAEQNQRLRERLAEQKRQMPKGAGSSRTEQRPGPRVVCLADVEPERVEWLWDGYLPLGKLVILDGDPGLGKSTITLDIAARVSTGSPMPDMRAGTKGAALVLSAEDGLADTIRPRLDAARADPARVITITEIAETSEDGDPTSRPVSLPGDLPAIERVIAEHGVVLVVVDVLMAYLAGDVNSHRDQDIRRALHQLAALADRHDCCVVALSHLNKSGGSNPLYRGGGSIGIVGAARAGYVVGADPDDETRSVFAATKNNLAPEPPALAYALVTDELHGVVRVQWYGTVDLKANDLLRDREGDDERSERDEAAEWLRDYLTDNAGEAPAVDVYKAGAREGYSKDTLKRAKPRTGVESVKGGMKAGWVWRLAAGREHEEPEEREGRNPQSPAPFAPFGPSVRPSSEVADEDYVWPESSVGAEENADYLVAPDTSLRPGCETPSLFEDSNDGEEETWR